MTAYNPYDLVTVRIGGEEIHGRPYEFDSQATNQQTMQNEFGGFVKPTHISTVCPKCGQGVMVENIKLPDPPFPVIDWACPNCSPGVVPQTDPFMNPLEAGRIADYQLDPLLHNPDEQVVENESNETVADRLLDNQESIQTHSTGALLVETVEPETAEPETVEPETVEPETVEPETVEPEKKTVTKKKAAKKTTKKKTKKTTEKRSPIKGTKMSDEPQQSPPEAEETLPLTTEKATKQKVEAAEGLTAEFDDDDMVEDE